jgi:hypothetical protein
MSTVIGIFARLAALKRKEFAYVYSAKLIMKI